MLTLVIGTARILHVQLMHEATEYCLEAELSRPLAMHVHASAMPPQTSWCTATRDRESDNSEGYHREAANQ